MYQTHFSKMSKSRTDIQTIASNFHKTITNFKFFEHFSVNRTIIQKNKSFIKYCKWVKFIHFFKIVLDAMFAVSSILIAQSKNHLLLPTYTYIFTV